MGGRRAATIVTRRAETRDFCRGARSRGRKARDRAWPAEGRSRPTLQITETGANAVLKKSKKVFWRDQRFEDLYLGIV